MCSVIAWKIQRQWIASDQQTRIFVLKMNSLFCTLGHCSENLATLNCIGSANNISCWTSSLLILTFSCFRTERQWRDLAFCLAQLSYNERGVRKLQENFACFQDKLSDEDVYGFFNTIMGKCKKFAKPEMKVVVDKSSFLFACLSLFSFVWVFLSLILIWMNLPHLKLQNLQ